MEARLHDIIRVSGGHESGRGIALVDREDERIPQSLLYAWGGFRQSPPNDASCDEEKSMITSSLQQLLRVTKAQNNRRMYAARGHDKRTNPANPTADPVQFECRIFVAETNYYIIN